jgi:uncharacterized protein (TIGR00255 family)
MTGFARIRKAVSQGEAVVSLKSVNHRGLDLHFHLPPELDPLESEIRAIIKSQIARGHVQIHITLARAGASAGRVNRALLEAYVEAYREAAALYQLGGQPDLNAALRIPGMLVNGMQEGDLSDEVARAVLEGSSEAVAMLNEFRQREGEATAQEIQRRCAAILALIARMEQIRNGAVPAFQNRLRERIGDLLHGAGIDPQRLAQEAAILADRSDIAEELVRLRTHVEHVEEMLAAGGEVGKRLDFLLQEMNRESNTMLSKTGGLGDLGLTLTDLALAAKSEIDKIREQALNLE